MIQFMSCKNYLLLIGIFSTVTMSYNDPEFVTRIGEFEKDMFKCFKNHNQYFGIKEDKSLKLSFDNLAKEFKSFHQIFKFINDTIEEEANDKYKNEKTPVELGEKLYKYAVWIYLLGSDNNGVKYHNFCHGMFVAYITYEFLNDKKALNQINPKLNKGQKAMYVFAGLFHDAGHPGMGNTIYTLDKKHRNKMIDYVVKKCTTFFNGPNNTKRDEVETFIKYIKRTENDSGPFFLENMHRELALMIYRRAIHPRLQPHTMTAPSLREKDRQTFTTKHNSNYEEIISESIDRTNMQFSSQSNEENVLFQLNHAADLALNGMEDKNLVFLGIEKVYNEFLTEIYHMRNLEGENGGKIREFINAEVGDTDNLPLAAKKFVPVAMPKSIEELISGQAGFSRGVILPVINKFNSYKADIFHYIKTNLDVNIDIFEKKAAENVNNLGTINADAISNVKEGNPCNAIVSELPYYPSTNNNSPSTGLRVRLLLI